jgi:3D-(3,5/4)-trihydroxycyclohexane-1,2-dione acylhydrolase (decyclizing)
MKKITLTCAHAIVKYLIAQKILINGKKEPLFPGVFGIFGHGNVACLGQALEENQKELPTYRGHHEQKYGSYRYWLCKSKKKATNFCSNIICWTWCNKYGYGCCSCDE